MVVVTRQQCRKIAGSCCYKRTRAPRVTPVLCTAYNLRHRPDPRPNYYETRVYSRAWTSRRKQKTREKPYARHAMEAAKRRRRGALAAPDAAAFENQHCDADCENLANDRIVEAVENMCTAFGIVANREGEYPGSWNVENSADIYARVFPEYAHEFSAGCSDISVIDLAPDDPDTHYRIPVIERGVVTPSWEDARCVVKQEMDDERYAVPQDLPQISASANETPVDSADKDALNTVYEESSARLGEGSDCRADTEEICDTRCTHSEEQVPDVKNDGVTNGPEECPLSDDDTEKPSMFFGESARHNWPSPTVFPSEKNSD